MMSTRLFTHSCPVTQDAALNARDATAIQYRPETQQWQSRLRVVSRSVLVECVSGRVVSGLCWVHTLALLLHNAGGCYGLCVCASRRSNQEKRISALFAGALARGGDDGPARKRA